jgi:hypothetical protein
MVRRRITRRKTRKVQAKVVKIINGKKYLLTKFAFSNKPAAVKTGKALKKVKRIKGVAVVRSKNVYLVYVRV